MTGNGTCGVTFDLLYDEWNQSFVMTQAIRRRGQHRMVKPLFLYLGLKSSESLSFYTSM